MFITFLVTAEGVGSNITGAAADKSAGWPVYLPAALLLAKKKDRRLRLSAKIVLEVGEKPEDTIAHPCANH